MCRLFLESRLICQEVRQLLADIRDVWLSWINPGSAIHTAQLLTVNTVGQDVVLIPSWAFTNRRVGGFCVRVSFGCTPCVRVAPNWETKHQRSWLITFSQSRMAGDGLTQAIFRRCASPVITERQRKRLPDATPGGRGSKSLGMAAKDARASSNFCACKLN